MIATRPARVLFLNSRSEFGGADMGLLALVRHLNPARFTSVVILPHHGPLVEALQKAGARIIYLDICRLERLANPAQLLVFLWRFASSLFQLLCMIRRESIDLVYTNSSAIQVGALAARLAGIPNVWHVREIWREPRWLTRPLYRYVYALANRIIAISHAVAQGNFGRADGKIRVVRDGIDLSRFQHLAPRSTALMERHGLDPTRPIVSTVARIVPQKGIETFIEAARHVLDAGIDVQFCIAGDIPRPMYRGYKEKLQQAVDRGRLSDRVFWLGWIDDVPALLNASTVFVLASAGPEGAGLVIPEAWLSGAAVIGPGHSGPAELVQHEHNGLLFEASNPVELGEMMLRLLREKETRRRLAETGRQDALRKHDARRNTADVQTILADLIQGHRGWGSND